ncbi:MAG: serine--tRNA ligase [Rhodothermia bacterium]|nr:serine--tRNA ligase [Rhodothermia bacterium]
MLDLQWVREHPDQVRNAMARKGLENTDVVDRLLEADRTRRAELSELQEAQARSNDVSREIGELMKSGRKEEANDRIAETSLLKKEIREREEAARAAEATVNALLLEVPNIPHETVPDGSGAKDNEVVGEFGERRKFDFEPLPHWEISENLGLIDFDRGSKVTGAGFPFFVGPGAKLERALIAMFLDLASDEGGYTEIQPPLLVNEDSARGTGQLPDKEDLMYEVPRDELYLVPTAEVPVTNLLRDEILESETLPIKYCAYSACFRREAGSYGKHVRGLNRLHQFDKVELVQFVKPEDSYETLETMRDDAERVLQRLGLPYRRLLMCTGDMGFSQAKKYDLEVWSAGQERWLEVSSISNFEAFQSRRMRIRYRPQGQQKTEFVHTLNGSALALPRTVAALLEHYQQANGTVLLPEPLRPYYGADTIG